MRTHRHTRPHLPIGTNGKRFTPKYPLAGTGSAAPNQPRLRSDKVLYVATGLMPANAGSFRPGNSPLLSANSLTGVPMRFSIET